MAGIVSLVAIVAGAVLTVAGGSLLWGAQRLYLQQRDGEQARISPGRVAVEGTATRHESVLTAPFSGHECLGYWWGVQTYNTGIDDDELEDVQDSWNEVTWDSALAPFRLETDFETVLVETSRVTLDLYSGAGFDYAHVVEPDETPPDRIREFADEHGISLRGRRRFVEHYLDVDETAYVIGEARLPGPSVDLPRDVDAAIGPPSADGPVDRLRQRLWPFSFRVADAGMEKALRRPWIRGFLGLLFGLPTLGFGVLTAL